MTLRRIVTGLGDNGKAVVLEDVPFKTPMRVPDVEDWENYLLWSTSDPTVPIRTIPEPPAPGIPEPGSTLFTVWQLPSDAAGGNPFGMHATDSIDYVVILSGSCTLVMEGGEEVELGVGDTVVQGGVKHAWHNRTKDPCVLVVVVVGAAGK